jgi:hypothetical protein
MRAAAVVANANGAAPPHHHVYPIAATTIQQGGALQVCLLPVRHLHIIKLGYVNLHLNLAAKSSIA